MEATDKIQLAERTRARSDSVWVVMDWGGLMSPLAAQQGAMNTLNRAAIENFMAVSDETWGIKESQRDRLIELGHAEIDQDREVAENKLATGRMKLAIQMATDEYVLSARVYDARVKALIMGAKEYAALAEQAELAVEQAKYGLAVDKEALHLKEVQAKIYYEMIQQAQVEAELARAQVDVAKAHVRALMADIDAGKAEIEVIDAEIEQYMAVAEKATIQADVAGIFADALTKQLTTVRLGVGQAEIVAGYSYIHTRLDDILALWDARRAVEAIRVTLETGVQAEIALSLVAEKAAEDLREGEVDNVLQVFTHEQTATAAQIEAEGAVRDGLVTARLAIGAARVAGTAQKEVASTAAANLVSAAQQAVHAFSERWATVINRQVEYISGD